MAASEARSTYWHPYGKALVDAHIARKFLNHGVAAK